MTLPEVKRLFINEFYGNESAFRKAKKDDYCKVQFEWSCFIDSLCKDGEITQKQYDKATFGRK